MKTADNRFFRTDRRNSLALLDQAFRFYRDEFWRYFGYTTLIMVPLTIIYLAVLTVPSPDSYDYRLYQGLSRREYAILVASVLYPLLSIILVFGPLTRMAWDQLFGKQVSVISGLHASANRLIPLALSLILLSVILGGFFATVTSGLLLSPLLIGLAFLLVTLYVVPPVLALLSPVVVVEKRVWWRAIVRAWALGRRRLRFVLGSLFLVFILELIVIITTTLITASWLDISPTLDVWLIIQVLRGLVSTIAGVICVPVLPIISTLLYYDIRSRLDQLDLMLITLDSTEIDPKRHGIQGHAPIQLTMQDLRQFVQLIILIILIGGVAWLLVMWLIAPYY